MRRAAQLLTVGTTFNPYVISKDLEIYIHIYVHTYTDKSEQKEEEDDMGEEAVLLRTVGLGSVADVLDGFYRQVLELNNEMNGKVRTRNPRLHRLF